MASRSCCQGGLAHVSQTTLLQRATAGRAELSLFAVPMQTVASVLDECGNDIDAAIRRLGQLKLSSRASEPRSDSAQDQAVRTAVAATAPEALLQESPAAGIADSECILLAAWSC